MRRKEVRRAHRLQQLPRPLLRQPPGPLRAVARAPRSRARVARGQGAPRGVSVRCGHGRRRRAAGERGAGVGRPGHRQHPHRGGVGQAGDHDVPPDLARHPAQADPPRRVVRTARASRPARPRHREVGPARVAQRGQHRAHEQGIRVRRRGSRDRLPAQRPAQLAGVRSGEGPGACAARDRRRRDRGALRAHVA